MFGKELNNAELWLKIQKLRELINETENFKKRKCWECGKDLNIYDFLSDNLEYTAGYILNLWQDSLFEFFCCECFKDNKKDELELIDRELKSRICLNCNSPIDIYKFSKDYMFLKISKLKEIWLNIESPIFCSRFCEKFYYRIKKKN